MTYMLSDQITAALDEAPRHAILGLSMRDEMTRERSKLALAAFIAERLQHPLSVIEQDRQQLPLPL
jgi:hypothetical protein